MRYRLTCNIDGALFLQGSSLVISECDGVRYELMADAHGRAAKAAVSLQVPKPKLGKVTTSLGPARPGSDAKAHITIDVDREIHETLVDALQRMESLLAVSARGPMIRRIRWDVTSQEFISETEEDNQFAHISEVTRTDRKQVIPSTLTQNSFDIMMQNADRYEPLRVVSGFWREAMADFQDGRYIQAVYNFYFVLEDMFASGKSAEPEVYRSFARSPELTTALEFTVNSFPNGNARNMNLLQVFLDEERLKWDVPGLRRFLIRIRGRLHHFSGRSSKRQGTPFTQMSFRSVALLLMHIVSQTLIGRMVLINRRSGPPKGPPPERHPRQP